MMLTVYANYGAMFPKEVLTVFEIVDGRASATNEDGETRSFEVSSIRAERPASGSPIGIYWNEMDSY